MIASQTSWAEQFGNEAAEDDIAKLLSSPEGQLESVRCAYFARMMQELIDRGALYDRDVLLVELSDKVAGYRILLGAAVLACCVLCSAVCVVLWR